MLTESGFKLDIRKKLCGDGETLKEVAREAVNAPSLEEFKVRLKGALASLV